MRSAGLLTPVVIVLLAVSVTGCGGRRVPVEGTVTLNGQPLAEATVTLSRSEGPSNERLFLGETDATGRYAIMTADRGSKGAPPGEFRVVITSVKVPPDMNELTKLPPDPVPIEWRNGTQTFTVPEGGTTEANFAMTSR